MKTLVQYIAEEMWDNLPQRHRRPSAFKKYGGKVPKSIFRYKDKKKNEKDQEDKDDKK